MAALNLKAFICNLLLYYKNVWANVASSVNDRDLWVTKEIRNLIKFTLQGNCREINRCKAHMCLACQRTFDCVNPVMWSEQTHLPGSTLITCTSCSPTQTVLQSPLSTTPVCDWIIMKQQHINEVLILLSSQISMFTQNDRAVTLPVSVVTVQWITECRQISVLLTAVKKFDDL